MRSNLTHASQLFLIADVLKGERQFGAVCRETGTPSHGDTIEEALENLELALTVQVAALRERGELETFIREKHLRVGSAGKGLRRTTIPGNVYAVRCLRIAVAPARRSVRRVAKAS